MPSGLLLWLRAHPWRLLFSSCFWIGLAFVLSVMSGFTTHIPEWQTAIVATWGWPLLIGGAFGWIGVYSFDVGKEAERRRIQAEGPIAKDEPEAPLQVLKGIHFLNETVLVDGKHFLECHFQSCTLLYNGGTSRMDGNHFKGVTLRSDLKAINAFIQMGVLFGVIPEVITDDGRVRSSGEFRAMTGNITVQAPPPPEQKQEPGE